MDGPGWTTDMPTPKKLETPLRGSLRFEYDGHHLKIVMDVNGINTTLRRVDLLNGKEATIQRRVGAAVFECIGLRESIKGRR